MVALLAIGAACTDYDVSLTMRLPTFGSVGATFPIEVSADDSLGGVALGLNALPTTIVISPASITLDGDGKAAAFALVPYGVSGSLVASGAFTTTASVQLAAAALTMCAPTFTPTQQLNANAQVYVATVRLEQGETCAGGVPAPSGVAVTMTVTQPSGSPMVAVLSTNANGEASLRIPVPWGASVFVLASGAGATSSSSVLGPAQPAVVSCLRWRRNRNVYLVEAVVKNGTAAFPLAVVDFALAPAMLGIVSPSKTSTGSDGVASAVVTVNDLASLPVVQAVSGTSSLAVGLTTDNEVVCQ